MNTEYNPLSDVVKQIRNIAGVTVALLGFSLLILSLSYHYIHALPDLMPLPGTMVQGLSLLCISYILRLGRIEVFNPSQPRTWITLLLLAITILDIGIGILHRWQGMEPIHPTTNPMLFGSVITESISFLLISLALTALLYQKNKLGIKLLQITALLSFMMLINYLYQVPYFYFSPFIKTNYPVVALSQFGISIVGMLFRPKQGLAKHFLGNKIGNIMLRRIFPWAILIIILQGYIRIFFFRKGTFTIEFGVAMATFTFLGVSLIILINTAHYLNKLNDSRKSAEDALLALNKSLEAIVKQRTVDLILSEEKFHKVFKMCPMGMVIAEVPSGKLLEVNERFIQQTGYTRGQIIGKSALEIGLLSPKDVEQTTTTLIHQGSISNFETPYFTQNGDRKMGLLSTEIIEIEAIRYAITTVFDVTERIAFEKKLQEVSQAKEQFLANMSHEIRTPMNAIVGFTSLLENVPMDTESQRYLSYIKSSGENLLVLVNDILDYSKIDAGRMVLERIPFNLPNLLQSIYVLFINKAVEKGLSLTVETAPNVPDYLIGDPTRLTQILTNLISNAVKFTEQGSVFIRLERVESAQNEARIRFQIQDTGIGIAQSKQTEIYDRFVQASAETTRGFGGSGLGLTIVKSLVELQNGDLELHSDLGKGTTFTVTIPYTIGQDTTPSQASTKALANVLAPFEKNIAVLLVEDHKLNQLLAESILKGFGCSVSIAANGALALDLLQNNHFDIVLMDIQMPVMDGYTAARLIRNKLKLTIPIIAMTAHVMDGEDEKCLSYGMNDYLSKPFNKEDLYGMLKKHLGQNQPRIENSRI